MEITSKSFFFIRLPLAVSMLGHGLVRLPKLETFSNWMVSAMEKSFLPQALVLPFSYVLPFAEAIIGLLLLIGFRLQWTLWAGLILMSLLILGSCSIENWDAVGVQLIHSVYFVIILVLAEQNFYFDKKEV